MKRIAAICFTMFLSVGIAFSSAGTYYTSINPSSPTFVNDLHTLINAHTVVSYDNYKTTIIPNYETLTDANGKYVVCVYSGEKGYYSGTFAWTPTTIFSREHTFCFSWMPSKPSTSAPEYCDQHHLFPADQNNANGPRSNHPLGIVVTPTSTFLEGKLGKDANGKTVYEPRNAQKGDAARALMYMMLCYNGAGGFDWTLAHLNTVTLPGASETTQEQSLLKAWSAQDPPDAWEIGRNDYIETIQFNRNPFVDHPEYVNMIDFNTLTLAAPVGPAAEPSNYVTNFAAGTTTSSSIQVTWTDAASGAQAPSGYLLRANTTGVFTPPVDGVSVGDDTNLADGSAAVNITYAAADLSSFSGLSSSTNYYFQIVSYNVTGGTINYKTDGTIPAITVATSVYVPPVLATEPSNYATNFAAGSTTSSTIPLTWTDAAAGAQAPAGYLLLANTTGVFAAPTDGVAVADDANLADGLAAVNIAFASPDSYTFTGLTASTAYYFQLVSYNGTGTSINYKTGGTIPAATATTADIVMPPGGFVPGLFTAIYEFTGTSTADNQLNAVTAQPGFGTFSTMTRTGAKWTAGGNYFNTNTWDLTRNTGKYLSFSLTLASGYTFQNLPLTLGFDCSRSSTGAGSGDIQYRYGLTDAFALVDTFAAPTLASTDPMQTKVKSIPAPGNGTSSVLEIRFFAWGATATNGTLRMDNVKLTTPAETAVPVELVSFTAQPRSGSVDLRWNTATEVNNYGFEVERAALAGAGRSGAATQMARQWTSIGFVDGSGSSNAAHQYSFVDRAAAGTCAYRLKQIDRDGSFTYSGEVTVLATAAPTGFALAQNYPNPFNPSTTIAYQTTENARVRLSVYDALGREVSTLVNETKAPGLYAVEWNAKDMPSGLYFYRLTAGSNAGVLKMLLQK